MRCDIKKGIFRQIACKGLATKSCSDCGIKVCNTHAEQSDGKTVCIKCYTKTQNKSNPGFREPNYGNDRYFYMSYWAMRSSYYNDYDDYGFDESDYSGFEDTTDEMYSMSESDEDDFLDS